MKPIPANIIASGPLGTVWFGGPVDRSKMTLRITGANVDKNEVSSLLGHVPKPGKAKHWSLSAPESKDADLDAQVQWLFAHVTSDLAVWKKLRERRTGTPNGVRLWGLGTVTGKWGGEQTIVSRLISRSHAYLRTVATARSQPTSRLTSPPRTNAPQISETSRTAKRRTR